MRQWLSRAILVLTIASVVPFTLLALRGQIDVGGDRGQHDGIERLAQTMQRLPAGTKVYDFWLGWELRFYLGDQPSATVIFEPSPEGMARAVCLAHGNDQYFVGPAEEVDDWLSVLPGQGVRAVSVLDGPFRLYRLTCNR